MSKSFCKFQSFVGFTAYHIDTNSGSGTTIKFKTQINNGINSGDIRANQVIGPFMFYIFFFF